VASELGQADVPPAHHSKGLQELIMQVKRSIEHYHGEAGGWGAEGVGSQGSRVGWPNWLHLFGTCLPVADTHV